LVSNTCCSIGQHLSRIEQRCRVEIYLNCLVIQGACTMKHYGFVIHRNLTNYSVS